MLVAICTSVSVSSLGLEMLHDDANALARHGTNEAYATYIRAHSVSRVP